MDTIKAAIQHIDELQRIAISGDYKNFLYPIKEFSKCVLKSSFTNPTLVNHLKSALISAKSVILNPSHESVEKLKRQLQEVKNHLNDSLHEKPKINEDKQNDHVC